MSNTALQEKEIRKEFVPELCKLNIELFDEIDSTNTYAKGLIVDGATEGLIVANCQTAGRGRSGHTFYSPKDSGIYMSYFYTPENGLAGAESCTTKTAVAVATAFESLYNEPFDIKWVNDIYYRGRKIAGILAEAVTTGINKGSVVIGIGINVSTTDYPDEIMDRAGHLPSKETVTRNHIVASIINNLVPLVKDSDNALDYVNQYRSRLLMLGEKVTFLDHTKGTDPELIRTEATVLDIDNECGLIVSFADGSARTIKNGEVSELRTSP